jgi:hypothetical protein
MSKNAKNISKRRRSKEIITGVPLVADKKTFGFYLRSDDDDD